MDDATGENDAFALYVNPTLDGDLSDETAFASGTGALFDAGSTFGAIQLRSFDAGGAATIDEIRIGDSFASVIPEPGSLALLSLGGLAVLGRQRR